MKKILALFLALSMLLSLLTVPTFAGEPEPDPESVVPDYSYTQITDFAAIKAGDPYVQDDLTYEVVTYNDATYLVVDSTAEFLAMADFDGDGYARFILGGNIDFKDVTVTYSGNWRNGEYPCLMTGLLGTTFHLEGNGYALNNLTVEPAGDIAVTSGLFGADATSNHKWTNLDINFSSVEFGANAAGALYGLTHASSNIEFTSVDVNVQNCSSTGNFNNAIFVAKPNGPVQFNNCTLSGKMNITNTSNQGTAGFIGKTNNGAAKISFKDCTDTTTLTANFGATAAFVGFVSAGSSSVSFERCDAAGDYSFTGSGEGCGAYVGIVYGASTSVTLSDCNVSGKFIFASKGAAAYIGRVNQANSTVEFDTCQATGTYEVTAGYAGVYIASVSQACKNIDFINCDVFKTPGVANSFTCATDASGVYVGSVTNSGAEIDFSNCDLNVNLTTTGLKSKIAGFVGQSNATTTFDTCTVIGTLACSGGQSAAFVGVVNDPGSATFTDCTVDATIIAKSNKTGAFVGQTYTSGTTTFNNCKVHGTFIAANVACGAFVGVAGGAYSNNPAETEPSRPKSKIYFNGCDVDAFMVGVDNVSPYVGTNQGGNPTITYDACKNNATVYSVGSAGSWYGGDSLYFTWEGSSAVTVNNNCTDNATIYAVTLFDGTTGNVTAEALADGSYAYTIAQAQAGKGLADEYIYGQTIGKDAKPVMGGATVYENDSVHFTKLYTNVENGVETLAATEGVYVQTTPLVGEGDAATFSTRVVIAIEKDKLVEIAEGTISVTFKDKDEEDPVKTVIFDKSELTAYYAVWADSKIAEAADGYALIAVTVSNIPVADWKAEVEGNAVTNVVVGVNLLNAQSQNIFGTQQQ